MEYQRRLLPGMGGTPGAIVYGGGGSAPSPPDYSQYISAMTGIGNQNQAQSTNLYNWATQSGANLSDVANTVGTRAGGQADWGTSTGQDLLANWEKTYGPVYQQQAQQATDFNANLPATKEQWAGKYAADVGQSFDQAKASSTRQLNSMGIQTPSIATGAIDLTAANQRAAATAAASETGRLAAMQYGQSLTANAEQAGAIMPQVSGQQSNIGLAAGNQQVNAPESAVSTTAGAYSPSLGYTSAAYPYLSQWGSTMGNAYNQQLAQFNSNQQASSGWGAIAGAGIGLLGTLGGAYLGGPLGAGVAGSAASKIFGSTGFTGSPSQGAGSGPGTVMQVAEGGMISTAPGGAIVMHSAPGAGGPNFAMGGDVSPAMGSAIRFAGAGQVVPPDVSPSRGAATDDVVVPIHGGQGPEGTAAINVGEFIWPKDVVAWRGEQWMQKEVAKARKERQEQTVAAPEHGAIDMRRAA